MGIFPSKLKLAKVIPIYKKDDRHILDNYRPISLLSTMSKVFEKVVFHQVYDYFSSNNLFYENQYGFRKKHSTEIAAIELVDRILGHLDQGNIPISVFLDLSKAFDTINHAILIQKLSFYGLRATPLKWFQSYLENRHQYTDFCGAKSPQTKIMTGVPQGSILGPLLFIIYMNDIHAATRKFHAIIYADDTNLTSPMCSFSLDKSVKTSNIDEISKNVNNELSEIQEWLVVNKLSLNVKKTKYMIFHHPQRKIENMIPDLRLNSEPIEKVTDFNFLGLSIDECLSWKAHVQKISNKMSRNIGIMRRLKHYLPLTVLRTIYNTLVLPYFQYSILTWGFRLGRVTLLQKRAMRVITCSRYNAHTDPLFKKLNLLKVQDFLEVNVLKMYYKYKNGELPLYMAEMFSTFSRAHNYNTRLSMTLDEPISLTPCGQLCIRYYLPKIVNKTNAALLSKVDTMSFESFTRCVKNSIISQYKEHCNNRGCFSCRWEAQAAGHPVNPPAWWLAESLSSRTAGVLHRDATGTTWTDHVFAT